MFLFKLLMDILLSHEHAVLLRSSPCCFPGKVRAVENRRDLTPRNVICDKLCISYISKGTEKEPKKVFQYNSRSASTQILLYIELLSRYMFRGYTRTTIRIAFLFKSHDDPRTGSKQVAA